VIQGYYRAARDKTVGTFINGEGDHGSASTSALLLMEVLVESGILRRRSYR